MLYLLIIGFVWCAQGKYNQADTSTVKEYVNQILSNGSVKTL